MSGAGYCANGAEGRNMRVETIGSVTLYLGDCREVVPTIGEIEALCCDPPYGMAFQSNHRNVQHAKIVNDDTEELLLWACGLPVRHSAYIFCRWDNLASVPKPKSCVTWVKNNWSMGDLQHEHGRQTEIALFYPGPEHDFPNGRPSDVVYAARTDNEHHPTEKPVSLMLKFMAWSRGAVLDPFMGSGTTGVAAVKAGRQFIGVEQDPAHFETACRRIREAAGEDMGPLFNG